MSQGEQGGGLAKQHTSVVTSVCGLARKRVQALPVLPTCVLFCLHTLACPLLNERVPLATLSFFGAYTTIGGWHV